MNITMWLAGLLSAAVVAVTLAALGDLLSEEIRGQLERLPHGLLQLAARRLPTEIREENLVGWKADLHEYLQGAEARPVTRLVLGVRCAIGAITSTSSIAQASRSRSLVSTQTVRPSSTEFNPDEIKIGYRGLSACVAAGISYRQLDYWARTGLVVPSVHDTSSGTPRRLYSVGDIVTLKVIKRLCDTGISIQTVRKAIDALRARGVTDLAGITMFSYGQTVYLCRSSGEVDLVNSGQAIFGIEIATAFRDVEATLSRLPREPR